MWIQDIEAAIVALKTRVDLTATLIDRISSGDGFIILTITNGEKYYYDIHNGDIQTEDEIEDKYTLGDLGPNWW